MEDEGKTYILERGVSGSGLIGYIRPIGILRFRV